MKTTTFLILPLLLSAAVSCSKQQLPNHIDYLDYEYAWVDDSIRVAYKTWGEGPRTMAFVHGFGCDLGVWQMQFEAFRDDTDLQLVFIDLPGYGESSKPDVSYDLGLFSRAVRTVLDSVSSDFAILVGHSLGTPVCRQVLYDAPMRVAGLCDVDGVYCFYPTLGENPTPEEVAAAEAYEAAVEDFAASFDGKDYHDQLLAFANQLAGPNTPEHLKTYVSLHMCETLWYVASSTLHQLIDRRWWNTPFPIPFPVEVICTQNSGLEPDNREKMQALYADMQYTELEDCGHFIQCEQPEVVNQALRRLMEHVVKNNLECYDFGTRELEQNYAGFPWVVTEERRPEYERIKQEYRDSISRGLMYGPVGVAEMCCYMQDFHLGCSFRMWSNRFPMRWANYKQEMAVYDPQPVAQKLDDRTFLLRFPSCCGDDAYVKWTWEAVEQYRQSGCENLVLDIRGNGGGADWQYYPIYRLLYLQPGYTHGIMIRNTPDNRERWLPWVESNESIRPLYDSAQVHSDEAFFPLTEARILHTEDSVDPRRPRHTAILIDRSVGSSGEQLLLDLRAVAPDVRLYGRDNTLGCIDISNVMEVPLPHVPNSMHLPTTVSMRVLQGERLIDGHGIEPDVRIDLPLPDTLSDNVDAWVRWVAAQMQP